MGKYKFVLVLEDSVCPEYIGKRLWQVLHAGAVPVYFGAESVNKWMPNPNSLIHISEFKTTKALAEHLTILNKDSKKYSTYLQHKPTYNDNFFTLITNKHLADFNLNDKYLHHFECLVCERVSKNDKIMKIGFKGYPYHADENRLKCPSPTSIQSSLIGLSPTRNKSIWQRKWTRSKYESQVISTLNLYNPNFTRADIEADIVRLARKDKVPMDQFLN
jgi:hypothetical protein